MDKRINTISLILLLWALLLCSGMGAQSPSISTQQYEPGPLSVEFVPAAGFYADSVRVQLLAPGARIYYTTDGSEPRPVAALRYTVPLILRRTTVVRALALMAGEESHGFSAPYFINEPETGFPVVSVAAPPGVLFDPVHGLLKKGVNAIDSIWYKPGANFWSRREIKANFEFFETDGQRPWANEAGFRLFGGMSRLFPQKSFSITARSRYGDKRIRHRIFGKKGLKKYKHLVFRNSGSDFGKSHFRDALMTHLVKDWNLDVQQYRPAHVYINGRYWGIYNIREKLNRYFIAGHYDVDKDSIDLIEHRLSRKYGSTAHYRQLLDFLKNNDLALPANYAYVQSQMDVDNFMDLQIAQIYFDNQDAGGNIRFWRPQTPNGRWRWILYDTDWGFSLNNPKGYRNNSLQFHTDPRGPHWPNPPWSTFLLRKLLENKDFRQEFATRFCDYLNKDLEEARVIGTIDKFYKRLLPEMPRHLQRWSLSRKKWEAEVEKMKTFANARPRYLRQFLKKKFNLGQERTLTVEVGHGGKIAVNGHISEREHFSGKYFEKTPVHLRAKPDLGYRFVRWEGEGIWSESDELWLELTRPVWDIRCVFEKYEHPLAGKIIINEVSCNNRQSKDWVEIYNNSKEKVNLEGWILADRKNKFRFPFYILPPKGYVVVCEDSAKFLRVHPRVQSLIGGLSFGLNKRSETIQLFSPQTAAVDSVGWTLDPQDTVFSYDLLLPTLDNSDPSNWEITFGNGSPGAANQFYLVSRIEARRHLWMQIGTALGVIFICLILLYIRRKDVSSFGRRREI
ncbi:MAG TPA: spore coat protein CotH [Bacteroidetes bacterium]|nr:spore coat protein CotH [Bacteroidota bacterium]